MHRRQPVRHGCRVEGARRPGRDGQRREHAARRPDCPVLSPAGGHASDRDDLEPGRDHHRGYPAAAADRQADLSKSPRPGVICFRSGFRSRHCGRRRRKNPFGAPCVWRPRAEPWRVASAEERLVEAPASEEIFAALASDVLAGARGFGGNDFKIPLTRRTLRAVMTEASLT